MNTNAKLCVYAICKNESKFIDRWISSLQNEADCVVVLDTGSTDDSVEKLKKYEPFVTVKQYDYFSEIGYFRFDKARNDSLKLVPSDAEICIVLDLDQVPRKGWSQVIRDRFKEGYSEVAGYIIDHDDNGNELNKWMSRNVHPNSPFWIWTRVIHEGIEYYGKEENKQVFDENFIIDHYPDNHKDRSLYKELLYYSCKEYPKDPYYGIYLGIELSRRYSADEAVEAFRRCLNECDFTGNNDIHYQCYLNLALFTPDNEEALDCIYAAKELGVETRRLYKILADVYERMEKYDEAIKALEDALTIQSNSNDWRDDAENFNGSIEDRLSLFYYYKKSNFLKSMEYCIRALKIDPNNERLNTNLKFYYEKYVESRRV